MEQSKINSILAELNSFMEISIKENQPNVSGIKGTTTYVREFHKQFADGLIKCGNECTRKANDLASELTQSEREIIKPLLISAMKDLQGKFKNA